MARAKNSGLAKAHPRVCGENRERGRDVDFAHGSSPRVRGKLSKAHRPGLTPGLIPACAGKTDRKPVKAQG